MPIAETEGIVLRHYTLGEADRIVVLLTREQGQLRGVAKGVRRPASRLAGPLEPLNHIRAEFYQREGADLCRIRRAEILRSFLGVNPSLDRLFGFSYFAELAQELVPENNPNPQFFRLVLSSLDAGEKCGVGHTLVCYFELWALRLSGLLPNYDYCSRCGACVKNAAFRAQIEAGQGLCDSCAGGRGIVVSANASAMLHQSGKLGPEAFTAAGWQPDAARGIRNLTGRLLALHLQKQLKTSDPLRQVLNAG